MSSLQPRDPAYAERVAASFGRQAVMGVIGASLRRVMPGVVEIALPFRFDLSQQHGFLHAGITTAIVDSACGYAALSLMPAGAGVLTVEFKVNFLAPAAGEQFIARGRVVRAGRIMTVCTGEVAAVSEGDEKAICLMQATMISVTGQPGVQD